MYSPKISEALIPYLYRWAKSEGVPMTKLVDRILTQEIHNRQEKEEDNGRNDDPSRR